MSSTNDHNADRAKALDTATLSDALDRAGLSGQCHGIMPISSSFRMVGRAFTVQYGPAGSPAGTVGEYLDDLEPGFIPVLANGARTDCSIWGDILTECAHARRVPGTVIDGICRDISLCLQKQYPVFSRGNWMRTGKDRVQVESFNRVVSIGTARVAPGDLLVGDADGLIVLAREHEELVLDIAEEIKEAEERIRLAVRSGERLADARRRFQYHALQRNPIRDEE